MKRKYEIAVVSKNGYARTVRIFAPKKADRAVIMHDGQNVFYDTDAAFGKSFRALDALKSLKIKNTAIIGVDSAPTRDDDYLPFPSDFGYDPPRGGRAEAYMRYIEDGLLPYLDKRFGFKRYAMVGASAGAVATLYFASRQNPAFGAYGLFSTPLFVAHDAFARFLDRAKFPADCFYEIYVGGSEREDGVKERAEQIPDMYVSDAFALATAIRKSGATRLRLNVENAGIHDETCWRAPFCRLLSEFSKPQ